MVSLVSCAGSTRHISGRRCRTPRSRNCRAQAGVPGAAGRRGPGGRRILVGGNGEHDPEIHPDFAFAHPEQVAAIALRTVAPIGATAPHTEERIGPVPVVPARGRPGARGTPRSNRHHGHPIARTTLDRDGGARGGRRQGASYPDGGHLLNGTGQRKILAFTAARRLCTPNTVVRPELGVDLQMCVRTVSRETTSWRGSSSSKTRRRSLSEPPTLGTRPSGYGDG